MTFIYVQDILPILITAIVFSAAATLHRVLLPNQYSSFIQFKGEEDEKRSAQSTTIRILYLIVGTLILHALGLAKRQILIGIFLACFLNVWPAIVEYHLLKIRKPKVEWVLLLGYICFIIFSVFVGYITLEFFIPSLMGESRISWLNNPFLSFILSLLMMAIPVPAEAVISHFSHVVMEEKIDTFEEEVLIIERELNIEYPRLKRNRYTIDNVARKYNISVKLLSTILKLEIFYRERMFYQLPEKLLCTVFKEYAIKHNVSVGIAQIKISTAEKILREDPHEFIRKLLDDKFNIEVCGRYLKELLSDYYQSDPESLASNEGCTDVYNYIARMYLGSDVHSHNRTVLIYSAVLRSALSGRELTYIENKDIEYG